MTTHFDQANPMRSVAKAVPDDVASIRHTHFSLVTEHPDTHARHLLWFHALTMYSRAVSLLRDSWNELSLSSGHLVASFFSSHVVCVCVCASVLQTM